MHGGFFWLWIINSLLDISKYINIYIYINFLKYTFLTLCSTHFYERGYYACDVTSQELQNEFFIQNSQPSALLVSYLIQTQVPSYCFSFCEAEGTSSIPTSFSTQTYVTSEGPVSRGVNLIKMTEINWGQCPSP